MSRRRPRPDPRTVQRHYYEATSSQYSGHHVVPGDAHYVALEYMSGFVSQLEVESVLDVGTGTGRSLQFLRSKHPHIAVTGVDPVLALLKSGLKGPNMPRPSLVCGSADHLPFADRSFDAVCESGVLHHVPDPEQVLTEMFRVARKAIFLSDSNRFGQGPLLGRLSKLLLYKAGLWGTFSYLRTSGRKYLVSEGDGVFYSYSVYDSLRSVARWADRVVAIDVSPAGGRTTSWLHPLLTSANVLLCGLKDAHEGALRTSG